MNKIDRLKAAYSKHIHVLWRSDASSEERVIFCVYNEEDDLVLRSKIDEFGIETRDAKHNWQVFDFTDTFATWLSGHRYAKSYYEKPDLLMSAINGYSDYLTKQFKKFLNEKRVDTDTVVALIGVGSLFGFLKVRDIVATYAPLVEGRLVVFFPGSYENNNYRLLDGYDGWNYLAVQISADNES